MSLNCSRIVVHRSFSKPDVRKSKRLDLMNNKIRLIELLRFFRSSFYLKKNLHFLKKLQFLIMNFNCKSLEAFIRNSLFVINICSDSRKTKAETTFEARWHSTFLAILQNLLLFQSYFLSSLLGFRTFFAFTASDVLRADNTQNIRKNSRQNLGDIKTENYTRELRYTHSKPLPRITC